MEEVNLQSLDTTKLLSRMELCASNCRGIKEASPRSRAQLLDMCFLCLVALHDTQSVLVVS